jgi:hypothetical protein
MRRGVMSELHMAKREGIMAITDIDTEYEMGKLTQEEHTVLREFFKGEVLPILKKEKDFQRDSISSPKREISTDLRRDIIREVMRVCGKDFSS